MLAEKITGEPYDQLVEEGIFTPLHMSGCSMPAKTDATIPNPYSHGYQLSTVWDRRPTSPAPLPALVAVTDNNPSWGFGAGQVICTAADLVIWAHALAIGQLLTPQMQAERMDWYTIQEGAGTRDSVKAQYGLGINKLNDLVGHNGEISGYQSQATRRTTDGTVIVVLSNLMIAPESPRARHGPVGADLRSDPRLTAARHRQRNYGSSVDAVGSREFPHGRRQRADPAPSRTGVLPARTSI